MGKRTNTAIWIESARRWQINVQKDGVRKTFTCATPGRTGQRTCNAKADKWLDDNINDTVTVSKMYEKWLKEIKLNTGTGNYTNYESYGRIHILPNIGKKRMSHLTEQDFQNVINSAFKKGLAKKTLNNIRGCIQTFLKYCRKNKTTTLFIEDLQISKKAPVGEKKILQPEHFKLLINCTDYKNFWYLNAYKLFALTGLREGELIELKKETCAEGKIFVDNARNRFGEVTEGKTNEAKRSFITISAAQKVIEHQINLIQNMDTIYLFPNKWGEVSSHSTIYHQWIRFCKTYEIPAISVHELRHTFISMCKEVPLELLKQVVGHSASMDTFGQYGHEVDGEKLLTQQLIEKEIGKVIK